MTWKKEKNNILFNEIKEKLIIYLKKGYIAPDSFLKKTNLNINNLRDLIELHFIFDESVINFIKLLPKRIRNIKTSVIKEESLFKGVQGQIDWSQTLEYRTKNNYKDKTNYICVSNDRNFNIQENIVLKKTLITIHNIINKNQKILRNEKLKWNTLWDRNGDLYRKFNRIVDKNIYVNRINIEGIEVTNRMISNTKKSRSKIYKEAAVILEKYNKFIDPSKWDDNTEEHIINLFEKTLIHPDNENVLFELAAVFKLISKYTDFPEFYQIEKSNNLVATWESNSKRYEIYHDSIGPSNFNFIINKSEIEKNNNKYLKRRVNILNQYNNILSKNSLNLKTSIWQGRPDIILVKYNQNKIIEEIIIGEVKYTKKRNYTLDGLYELIEYLNLMKIDNKYINNIIKKGILFSCNDEFCNWDFDIDIKYFLI